MFHYLLIPLPILQLCARSYIPESPRWLLRSEGRARAAQEVGRLRPLGYPAQAGEDELNAMVEEFQAENPNSTLMQELRTHPQEMRIACGLIAINTLTGVNTFVYWGDEIVHQVSQERLMQKVMTLALPAVDIVFTLVPIFLIDKVGRRKLLAVSISIMMASLFALGVLLIPESSSELLSWMGAACMLTFMMGFGMALGGVPWVVALEVFATRTRAPAYGIAMCFNWIGNTAVSYTHLRAHETVLDLVCRLLLEKKK
eukprot:TRINITY_DN1670_c0_g2_i2.p1 TRINITY_DN1670_c0_g2~~TRINITY_DN1670_c0_g2_i2.p1  ORF type:complete len:257 (-),score=62.75 TRINITY_DN1670_c0_g2_i2:68-838(-)